MDENYFKAAREKVGLSQFEAAVKIGVTASAVSGWERGQVPRLNLVDSICKVYRLAESEVLRVMKEMSSQTAAAK